MNFIDKATVLIKAGDGGNGHVSFRHEKFVDKGGPDGGDGGNGGSVIFTASRNQNTLASFRFQRELKATPGTAGDKQRKHGRNGKDFIVEVPVGTTILSEAGEMLADLTEDGQRAVIARGGKGGFGNAHFVSSKRQAPRIAEKGEAGQELQALLELKMIADVGLVGLPNAGKSTLLSVVSNARPEIADYPFTTIVPNLGVVDVDGNDGLLIADIPGLIEGAAEGKGLGDEFLRHVERTAVLLHLIDAYQPDVVSTYQTIQQELKSYKIDLSGKPQVVVLTKIEGLDQDIVTDELSQLQAVVPPETPLMAISAQTHTGLTDMLRGVSAQVQLERKRIADIEAEKAGELSGIPVIRLENENLAWRVTRENEHTYLLTGHKIEKFAGRTDFENEHGVQRLRDIMKKMGILHELVRQRIKPGDIIKIGGHGSIEY